MLWTVLIPIPRAKLGVSLKPYLKQSLVRERNKVTGPLSRRELRDSRFRKKRMTRFRATCIPYARYSWSNPLVSQTGLFCPQTTKLSITKKVRSLPSGSSLCSLRERPRNAVLGSKHHCIRDRDRFTSRRRYAALPPIFQRQPFLWRFLRPQIEKSPNLIDGRYVGFMLNSYWNDPIVKKLQPNVEIKSDDDVQAEIKIEIENDRQLSFTAVLPIHFHGVCENL